MSELDHMQGTPIVMPKLGLTMSEGLIAEWQVKPGDDVTAGQVLFVVETDKISNEIEAPAPGRIVSLLVDAGETVPVGAVVALWTGNAQGGMQSIAPPPLAEPSPTPVPVGSDNAARIRATPLARRLAASGGIALSEITGSGARGRIQGRDVRTKLEEASISPQAVTPAPIPAPTPAKGQRDLRPLIAARVSRAKAEIPHFYVSADAQFDALAALRTELNGDEIAPRKLTVTAMLAMAVARAVRRQPGANAVWRDGRAIPLDQLAIGIAVDAPGGVMAPVVPVTGGIYAFAEAMEGAIDRARQGRLSAADTGAAAIGVSNVGMFGVRALTPIIDPDQSFMLGVGAPHVAFRLADDGSPRLVRQVTLTLACDHRLTDGVTGARLLTDIVSFIEHPLRLIAA